MTMTNLIAFLFFIFIIFTLICIFFCIEAHFRYQNHAGIANENSFTQHYKYFGQPIYQHDQRLIGYELLLRQYNSQSKQWQLPENIEKFPLNWVVAVIREIDPKAISQIETLALNMTVSQLIDPRANYFFNWLLGTINHQRIIIELNASEIVHVGIIKRYRLLKTLKKFDRSHIKVAIENVGSSKKEFSLLRPFLPYLDYLEFDITSFKKSLNHWIDITLAQWQRCAREYQIVTAVIRVEDPAQVALANQLEIKLRQGYSYGKPQPLSDY